MQTVWRFITNCEYVEPDDMINMEKHKENPDIEQSCFHTTDEEIQQYLDEWYGTEEAKDIPFFKGYSDAIIGLSMDDKLIYNFEYMVVSLAYLNKKSLNDATNEMNQYLNAAQQTFKEKMPYICVRKIEI